MNTKEQINNDSDVRNEQWGGYTLDEIRFQRAYTLARLEIEKNRIRSHISTMQSNLVPQGRGGSFLLKLFGAFSYFDYAVLAFKLVKAIFSVRRIFRR